MGRYLRMLLGHGSVDGARIVSSETLAAMLVAQNADVPLDLGMKIGLSFILSDPDLGWAGKTFWHNGATYAFRSHLEVLPDQNLGVFVVCNSMSGGGVAEGLAKALLLAALELKRGQAPPESSADGGMRESEAVRIPLHILEAMAGLYVNDDSGLYAIIRASPEGFLWTRVTTEERGGLRENAFLAPVADGFFHDASAPQVGIEFRE